MSGVLSRNSLEHAVAGTAGSVLATLLLFPLERVKTLVQIQSKKGLLKVLRRVLKEEGAGGLYRGCTPMLQTVGTSNFLYFFLFEGLKDPLANLAGRPEGEVGSYETLAASALAGALNMAVTEPLWRACVVAQAVARDGQPLNGDGSPMCGPAPAPGSDRAVHIPDRRPVGVFFVVYRLWAKEGSRALWRGLGSSLWLVMNPVIQFFAYDILKTLARSPSEISSIEAFFMGAAAKALATVLTFPLQVAQSRLRVAREASQPRLDETKHAAGRKPELQGMVPCLRAIWEDRGLRGLYSGLFPKLVQTVTQAAFMFALYEKVHRFIRQSSKLTQRRLIRRLRSLR